MSEELFVPSDVVHENANYVVKTTNTVITVNDNDYEGGYFVVNKSTNVTEFMSPALPEAIYNAEHFNTILENKLWSWVASQGARQSAEVRLEDVEIPDDAPAN